MFHQHLPILGLGPILRGMTPLILASTSPYRKMLLSKLGLSFQTQKPLFDEESAKKSELDPVQLCVYLGQEKARSLSNKSNCVIGSDQMLVLGTEVLGKPGTAEKAAAQLMRLQGKTHELLTSVSVYHQGNLQQFLNRTILKMLPLTLEQVKNYVELDQPLDCAGSYKIEMRGISLFEKIEGDDFTAIQGLPLMELGRTLRQLGYIIPNTHTQESL